MITIGGGDFKGRKIKTPNTVLTRPSTSYSRKVIFDTLAPYMEESIILDLFAGSGSLGIEALSRGARFAYFVDSEITPIATIKENISSLGITDKSNVIKSRALECIKGWEGKNLDIIFLDPPYSLPFEELNAIFSSIKGNNLLNPNGFICLEVPTKRGLEITNYLLKSFSIFKEKKKGDTLLLFLK